MALVMTLKHDEIFTVSGPASIKFKKLPGNGQNRITVVVVAPPDTKIERKKDE